MTTNKKAFIAPLSDPLDILLADVAIRIQLSNTDYNKAVERYQILAEWLERPGSPLAGKVDLVYPQGSMAVGSTISSKLKTDEFDIDLLAQLRVAPHLSARQVLDELYAAVRGEPGSRYYDMTTRRTRCVTIQYADGMHLDITPAELIPGRLARTSNIFHSKPEDPEEPDERVVANPYGFAEWFKQRTPVDHDFAKLFEGRAQTYAMDKAETEDVPAHEPAHRKSKALITLQLLKRWKNVRYDGRSGRRPPSIMMTKLVADHAGSTDTLADELAFQAEAMFHAFDEYHSVGRLISVQNPACPEDEFTDRWPATLREQDIFVADLRDLVAKTRRLKSGCSLDVMQVIMKDLFGEAPTGQVFKEFAERKGNAIATGNSHHRPGRGGLDLVASGIVAGAAASTLAKPTRPHTFYGDKDGDEE